MPSTWIIDGPGKELWEFGREGGFREMQDTPALGWLLGLHSVRSRAREFRIEESEAARQLLDGLLVQHLDDNRRRALRIFLQIEISGHGRDLGARRDRAGRQMTSAARPKGISGRTWEREYEQPAIQLLTRELLKLDRSVTEEREPVLLVVLPLRVTQHGSLDQFMAAGFTEDIVARLSHLEHLSVLSPDSLGDWAEDQPQLEVVREHTGADVVLSGAIREYGGTLHLALRLDDARTGVTRWSETFDFAKTEVLTAQVAVANAVASTLDLRLTSSERARLAYRETQDPRAYELYLRAKGLAAGNNAPDNQVALGLLEQALALDDELPSAHALKGYLMWRDYFSGWGANRSTLDAALACVDRAIKLNPRSVDARFARIRICWDLGWHEEAVLEGHRAVEDNPHSTESFVTFARALTHAGLADLGLGLTRTVLQREPGNVTARKHLVWNLLMTRQYAAAKIEGLAYHRLHPADANTAWAVAGAFLAAEEYGTAIDVCSTALSHDRTDATHWLLLGFVHQHAGAHGLAHRAWEDGATVVSARVIEAPTNLRLRAWLANIYACAGDRSGALREIRFFKELEPENGYLAYRAAGAYAILGNRDPALDELRAAIQGGFRSAQLLRFEERLSLSALASGSVYNDRVTELEKRVDQLRAKYRSSVSSLVSPEVADDYEE